MTPDAQMRDAEPSEDEVYAEHRAALEATLFPAGPSLVFELRDGTLHPLR